LGDVHAAYAPLSSLHWNVEPDSVAVNENDAEVEVVEAAGWAVIVVSGAVVSAGAPIVQVTVAGEASTLPAASVARTVNVCEPTASEL
jgi:hypothetical protein